MGDTGVSRYLALTVLLHRGRSMQSKNLILFVYTDYGIYCHVPFRTACSGLSQISVSVEIISYGLKNSIGFSRPTGGKTHVSL